MKREVLPRAGRRGTGGQEQKRGQDDYVSVAV